MWSFADLNYGELHDYANGVCECKSEHENGLRNGYTCLTHRAQNELKRRWVAAQDWTTSAARSAPQGATPSTTDSGPAGVPE